MIFAQADQFTHHEHRWKHLDNVALDELPNICENNPDNTIRSIFTAAWRQRFFNGKPEVFLNLKDMGGV